MKTKKDWLQNWISNNGKLYVSEFQRKVALVNANTTIIIAGRGTGKSTQCIANRTIEDIHAMPGACIALLGNTYTQVQERTLASTVSGWGQRGFLQDKHWKVGKPLKGWGKPLYTPLEWDKCISTYTGTILVPVSLDRPGLANSYTFWEIIGDEAKMFDYEIMKEDILPTLRAPTHYFPNCPHQRGLFLTTSMPSLPEGQWLLDFEKQQNPKLIEKILSLAEELEMVKVKCIMSKAQYTKEALQKEIDLREKDLNILRKNCTFYIEASTLSNIDILDFNYIITQKKLLGDKFNTEILNIRPQGTNIMFYNGLGNKNFYSAYDYAFIDNYSLLQTIPLDYRRDKDYNPNLPLLMGFDFGARFNGCVVCQDNRADFTFRVINNFYVENGGTIAEVVEKFNDYYGAVKYKMVYLYYDNTGNNRQGIVKQTPAEELETQLTALGWRVQRITKGGANLPHHKKYFLWEKILNDKDSKMPKFLMNKNNCDETICSMKYAGAIRGKDNLIQKDKSSERKISILPRYATHLSDCLDTVVYPIYKQYDNIYMI